MCDQHEPRFSTRGAKHRNQGNISGHGHEKHFFSFKCRSEFHESYWRFSDDTIKHVLVLKNNLKDIF